MSAVADDEGETRHCDVGWQRRHNLKERRVLQIFAGLVRDEVLLALFAATSLSFIIHPWLLLGFPLSVSFTLSERR
nr:hypothetical protein Iba_chr02bCG7920 [Ipomoea batatas]